MPKIGYNPNRVIGERIPLIVSSRLHKIRKSLRKWRDVAGMD